MTVKVSLTLYRVAKKSLAKAFLYDKNLLALTHVHVERGVSNCTRFLKKLKWRKALL